MSSSLSSTLLPACIIITIDDVVTFQYTLESSDYYSSYFIAPFDKSIMCFDTYYGSGTRIGSHASVWTKKLGIIPRTVKVYFYDIVPPCMKGKFLIHDPRAYLITTEETNFGDIGDFSHIVLKGKDVDLGFAFRELHKFGNDVEISGISINIGL